VSVPGGISGDVNSQRSGLSVLGILGATGSLQLGSRPRHRTLMIPAGMT
jgi:hypothetical protein